MRLNKEIVLPTTDKEIVFITAIRATLVLLCRDEMAEL